MRQFAIASLGLAVLAFSTIFLSVPEAGAQSGSRLCGISKGPVAFLVEVKQPKSKKGRSKTNKACKELAQKFRDGIPGGAKRWKYYERSECEGVAKAMGDARGSDICEGFRDQNGKAAMERNTPYKVQFSLTKKAWTFERLQ